jgi:hypothetical protein
LLTCGRLLIGLDQRLSTAALLFTLLAGCAAPQAWQPARPLDTTRPALNPPPLLVNGYKVPSETASRWINYGVQDGLLAERAELRLETNTYAPHRLVLEMSSSNPARVAVFLNSRRLGDAETGRPASFTVPADWLRPDFYATVRLEPAKSGVVRLQSIALEPLPQ